nr:hypothetical protein [Deltaproteobacteria bacterium]
MKTNLRGMLATMLATGLLAACSSEGGNNPGTDAGVPTDMGVTTDMGGTDAPRTDARRAGVPRPARRRRQPGGRRLRRGDRPVHPHAGR